MRNALAAAGNEAIESRRPAARLQEPSAAQNETVIQTCQQCGAVNPVKTDVEEQVCFFCDARLTPNNPEDNSVRASENTADAPTEDCSIEAENERPKAPVWRSEVTHRVAAYRARGRLRSRGAQPEFRFESAGESGSAAIQRGALVRNPTAAARRAAVRASLAGHFSDAPVSDTQVSDRRPADTPAPRRQPSWEDHVVIDLAQSVEQATLNFSSADYYPRPQERPQEAGDFSAGDRDCDGPCDAAAPLGERVRAGAIDAALLIFAYGGFLALFWAMGGRLAFTRLDAAVTVAAFGLLYTQYCFLFAVFGGATPGMMARGLTVESFDGSEPDTGQLLWRSAGYPASAVIGFGGFLWALWDRDHLTWHDRISHTYITFG